LGFPLHHGLYRFDTRLIRLGPIEASMIALFSWYAQGNHLPGRDGDLLLHRRV
jgi:hypothetical protein